MKTVQRSASCTGAGEASATASNSSTMSTPSLAASSCRKLPVPAAQTLFMSKSTACRCSRRMYLASCPPISKIVSHLGVGRDGAAGVRRDLVDDQVRGEEVADHLPAGARGGQAQQPHAAAKLGAQARHQVAGHLDRPPARRDVALGAQLPHRVDQGEFRRRRADVDAQPGAGGKRGSIRRPASGLPAPPAAASRPAAARCAAPLRRRSPARSRAGRHPARPRGRPAATPARRRRRRGRRGAAGPRGRGAAAGTPAPAAGWTPRRR